MRKAGKEQLGVRAFGDCNAVLREVMRQLLTNKDRVEWERGRMERLKVYFACDINNNNYHHDAGVPVLKISNPNPFQIAPFRLAIIILE